MLESLVMGGWLGGLTISNSNSNSNSNSPKGGHLKKKKYGGRLGSEQSVLYSSLFCFCMIMQ
jgi:hypothetical protein